MSDPREIELKLDIQPRDASALRRKGAKLFGGTSGTAERLSSVYFDTPARTLHKKGLALRVRSDGKGHVQTLKARGGATAGLFDRSEWETAVAGEEPEPKTLSHTPVAKILSKRKPLKPVFETVVDRTTWTVTAGQSTVEVALDQGRVVAGGKSCDFAELELELKQGSAGDLFDVARKVGAQQRVKIGVVTKSERGYALAADKPTRAFKAESVELHRDMTSADAVRAIAHACLRQFRLNETVLIETRNVEALHEARVGMRRFRSALSLFKDLVADDALDRLKDGLRDLSHALGHARNLDVYLERAVLPEVHRDAEAPSVLAFLDHVRSLREQAYDDVAARLNDKKTRKLMIDLLAWIEAGPWLTGPEGRSAGLRDAPIGGYAAQILDTRFRKLRKMGKRLGTLDPTARHRVRIEAKKLRYAAEFFSALNAGKTDRRRYESFLKTMKAFQDYLGELNDLHTGHEMAEDLARSAERNGVAQPTVLFAAGHLSGEQDEQFVPLLKGAVKAYEAFADTPRFWRIWPA